MQQVPFKKVTPDTPISDLPPLRIDKGEDLSDVSVVQEDKTLGFSLPEIERMITRTEAEIAADGVRCQELYEPFKEAEQMYLEEKAKYDAALASFEQGKAMLDKLTAIRSRTRKTGEIRLMRTTSHTNKPVKETARIRWQDAGKNALMAIGQFVDPYQMFEATVQLLKDRYDPAILHKAKHGAIHNFKKQFVFYEGKLGLKDWTGEDGRPTGKYLEVFLRK